MIHSAHAESASNHTENSRAPRAVSPQKAGASGERTSPGSRRTFGFVQPAFNSLWDSSLLDRLSLPLTRYHE